MLDQDYVTAAADRVNRLLGEALQLSQEAHRLLGREEPTVDQDYVMSSLSGWMAACDLALSINKLALARFCPLWAMGELYGQALRTVQPLP